MAPVLSILIPTLGSRREKFLGLLGTLMPQVSCSAVPVEVIALYNHGERSIAVLRQRLLESASGTFTAFIDDDDGIRNDYVDRVTSEIVLGPEIDSVGFRVRLAYRGQVSTCSRRMFALGTSPGHPHVWDWGIMTPTRTSLMRQCRFDTYPGGPTGEDGWFKGQLLPRLGPEAYVDEPLYEYRWDPRDSVQTRILRQPRPPRPVIASGAFRWDDWSSP